TEEHPLGVYHPHAELHHIKKENIGLIEVMGLAVLPSRLKGELAALEKAILTGADISTDPVLSKHAPWVEELKTRHTFTKENTASVLQEEVGQVFRQVLEHAGVYKHTDEGRRVFLRFIDVVNQEAGK
ncbi:MAG: galactose-1-phosphate uridylyltransferase, partial [Lachnospiraceae bacterium]|nr:galactose-1-phosphate uridylyltransferase [Lachnospiraceae bacterium]